MKITLFVLMFGILNLFCSQQPQVKNITFKQELTIGQNTELEGGWFNSLKDFYVDKDGQIYCADGSDQKIKVFDRSGNPVFQFGQKGQGPGDFAFPNAIVVSKNDEIYVADMGLRNISKFTKNGKFINSVKIGMPVIRVGMFDSGNLVIEIAKIDRHKEITQSIFELRLYDAELNVLKNSIYERPVEHYAWITTNDQGQAVTQKIPFAPQIVWNVIGDRLYVGYNAEYKISVFDDNGNFITEIIKQAEQQKVPVKAKTEWIETTIERFSGRANFMPGIMKRSMEKISFPKFMPAFTSIAQLPDGFVVFENSLDQGIMGMLYKKNYEEIQKAIFSFDGFKYFHGKFYKIIRSEDEPVRLIRYSLVE